MTDLTNQRERLVAWATERGLTFIDPVWLLQAFTHRSYLNENRESKLQHNERLEFLGDAVLELAVTDHLYRLFPAATEGDLTRYRAALVNTEILSREAERLGFNDLLLLSRGESQAVGRGRLAILANTFEALIGALYIDGGYEPARRFVAQIIFPLLSDIVGEKLWLDAKSRLQEQAQDKLSLTPTYQVLVAAGPDHDKRFTVGVYFDDQLVARGEGQSKQEAEQVAAAAALIARGWQS